MNTEETFVWVQGLLPGEATVERRRVGESFPEFAAAQIRLGGAVGAEPDDAILAETVAMTIDAGRIECGLETEDGSDLRVEILTVVSGHGSEAVDLLAHAATMIAENPAAYPPQPGTLLPDVAQGLDPRITARNGLLVVPYVWDEGVPHVHEVSGGGSGRHSKEVKVGVEFTHPGRLTIAAQLVLLTDEEFRIAQEQGIAAGQQHLVAGGVNINDIWR